MTKLKECMYCGEWKEDVRCRACNYCARIAEKSYANHQHLRDRMFTSFSVEKEFEYLWMPVLPFATRD